MSLSGCLGVSDSLDPCSRISLKVCKLVMGSCCQLADWRAAGTRRLWLGCGINIVVIIITNGTGTIIMLATLQPYCSNIRHTAAWDLLLAISYAVNPFYIYIHQNDCIRTNIIINPPPSPSSDPSEASCQYSRGTSNEEPHDYTNVHVVNLTKKPHTSEASCQYSRGTSNKEPHDYTNVHVVNLTKKPHTWLHGYMYRYTWSWASIWAPALSSSATIDEWPIQAAIISPVLPSCYNNNNNYYYYYEYCIIIVINNMTKPTLFLSSMFVLNWISNLAISVLPWMHATWRAEFPFCGGIKECGIISKFIIRNKKRSS